MQVSIQFVKLTYSNRSRKCKLHEMYPNALRNGIFSEATGLTILITCCRAKSPETPNDPSMRRYSSDFLPGKCRCISSTEQI